MAETTNYGLQKPAGTDYYDIGVQNANMDAIDAQMKANSNGIATKADSTAVTAALALKADKSVSYTATLPASGWTGTGPYTQTVAVAGMISTAEPFADLQLSETQEVAEAELESYAYLSRIVTGEDSITAICLSDVPEVDLNIRLKVVY